MLIIHDSVKQTTELQSTSDKYIAQRMDYSAISYKAILENYNKKISIFCVHNWIYIEKYLVKYKSW